MIAYNNMRKNDIIFAAVCGLLVSWLVIDFFGSRGWVAFLILPELSILGLWLSGLIGKKTPFVGQIGKFVLAGVSADVIDIKVFQLLFWFAPFPLLFKGVSFLAATIVKFWLNKHWAFEKHEKDGIKKEIAGFFAVTLAGLALNIGSFYYFTKILGPQFSMSIEIWTELCIIFSALVAAVGNFLGYKFLVFKK